MRMVASASIQVGLAKSNLESRTSSLRSTLRWELTGRSKFATLPRAEHTCTSILLARTAISRRMNCLRSTARVLFVIFGVFLPAALAAEPGMVVVPGGQFNRGRTYD